MKIIPISRNALVFDPDDWKHLNELRAGFDKVCDNQSCENCPLSDFCLENSNPAEYLKCLYEFLRDTVYYTQKTKGEEKE